MSQDVEFRTCGETIDARPSLESGLRAANVTGLRWSAVDLGRKMAWVHPDEAKARKAIPMPLDGEAVSILHKQIGKQTDCRGTKRGNPLNCRGNLVGPERLERSTYGLRVRCSTN